MAASTTAAAALTSTSSGDLADLGKPIPADEFQIEEKLGEGTSAHVFKGRFQNHEVAIKVIKPQAEKTERDLANFAKELRLLEGLKGQYVVGVYGYCREPRFSILLEYCSRGSLYHVLTNKRLTEPFSWALVFQMARQIGEGLRVLHTHEPEILHRDLKSLNVLVTDKWQVRMSDFGLTRLNIDENKQTLGRLRGTFAYAAPELYWGKPYTKSCDVYSLAVLFWEMVVRCMTGVYERPYGDNKNIVSGFQLMIQTAKKGLRPTIPPNTPASIATFLAAAWNPANEKRPSVAEVLVTLDALQAEYTAARAQWDALCRPAPPPESDSPSLIVVDEPLDEPPPPPRPVPGAAPARASGKPSSVPDDDGTFKRLIYHESRRLTRNEIADLLGFKVKPAPEG